MWSGNEARHQRQDDDMELDYSICYYDDISGEINHTEIVSESDPISIVSALYREWELSIDDIDTIEVTSSGPDFINIKLTDSRGHLLLIEAIEGDWS